MPLLMNDLENYQREVLGMLEFAQDHGELRTSDPDFGEFSDLLLQAGQRQLSREELEKLTSLIQKLVILPVFTLRHAAAWLGITDDALRHAIWRADPPLIRSFKAGHDRLITYQEVARYAKERRYA